MHAAILASILVPALSCPLAALDSAGASVEIASPMMSPRGDVLRFRPGCWIPVSLMFLNEGHGDVAAEIVISPADESGAGSGEFVLPARMPSSSRKVIPGLATASSAAEFLKISCSVKTVALTHEKIRLKALDNDIRVALMLTRDSGARSFFADEAMWGGPFEVFPCDQALLPDRPEGLEPVDWVLLPDDCAIDADRARALSEWVKRGGCILIWSGAGRDAGSASAFIDLPDQGFESVDSAALGIGTGGSVRVRKIRADAGTRLWAAGDLPLLISVESGAGRVVYLAADPSRPGMNAWAGRIQALAPLLSGLRRPMTGLLHEQAAVEIGRVPISGRPWRILGALAIFAVIAGPPGFFVARRFFRWRTVLLVHLTAGATSCAVAAAAGTWLSSGETGSIAFTVTHSSAGAEHALVETWGLSASGAVSDLCVTGESGEIVGPMLVEPGKTPAFRCYVGTEPRLVAPGLPAGAALPWRKLAREPFRSPAGRFECRGRKPVSGSMLDPDSQVAGKSALVFGHRTVQLDSTSGPSGARLVPSGAEQELGLGVIPNTLMTGDYAKAMGRGTMRREPSSGAFLLQGTVVSRRGDGGRGILLCRTELETGPDAFRFPPGFIERRWLDIQGKPVEDLPEGGMTRGLNLLPNGQAVLEGMLPFAPDDGDEVVLSAGTSLIPVYPKKHSYKSYKSSSWISPPYVEWYLWDEQRFGATEDHSRLVREDGAVLVRFTNTGTIVVELVRPWIEAKVWTGK